MPGHYMTTIPLPWTGSLIYAPYERVYNLVFLLHILGSIPMHTTVVLYYILRETVTYI